MISVSEALRKAITADARRVRVRATVKIVDPDLTVDSITAPTQAAWSDTTQLFDEAVSAETPLAVLEKNIWVLDGSCLLVEHRGEDAQVGYVSSDMCDENGDFATAQVITLAVSGATKLLGLIVSFSDRLEDGLPKDVTLEIINAGGVAASKHVSDNTDAEIQLDGVDVSYPTAIRITVASLTLPYRRFRMMEVTFGIVQKWTDDNLVECDIGQQGDFSGLALPYGTCRLTIDNHDRKYEPRKKSSIFQAIEDRQAVQLYLGADVNDSIEYAPVGVYYQHENGWKTSANAATMTWDLVDIIGLLKDRAYAPTATLPTTLAGWAQELVSQLGVNFANCYSVDANYASLPCTVTGVSALADATCGQILIWICQATGTFARADSETGYLAIEPYWNQGVMFDLDNLESYPEMSSNDDISMITFTLSDNTTVAFNGNSISASKTASVNNPFLHTAAQAKKVAEQIITAHGGNQIEVTGRGDFTSEIGDVATVQLDESNATTARVIYQTWKFSGGILKSSQTRMLQAAGGKLYDETVVFTSAGTWTCPNGVTSINLTLGQGGQGGGKGHPGYVGGSGTIAGQGVSAGNGDPGVAGHGGKIFHATIAVVAGQSYSITVGGGGAAGTTPGQAGSEGTHTTFAAYSSANGELYANGYTDILNGNSYGRSAVEAPVNGTSDGGVGGEGGAAGGGYWQERYGPDGQPWGWDFVVTKEPTQGKAGKSGASGFCLIQYVRVV